MHSHSYRLSVSYDYDFCNFTWFPGVKWIFWGIFSCIMKLQQYSSELRANDKCIPRAFCFSNLKSGFNFTAVFQANYSKNMIEQIQNFKYAGKDSFNLRVKSLTHYKIKSPGIASKIFITFNQFVEQIICGNFENLATRRNHYF